MQTRRWKGSQGQALAGGFSLCRRLWSVGCWSGLLLLGPSFCGGGEGGKSAYQRSHRQIFGDGQARNQSKRLWSFHVKVFLLGTWHNLCHFSIVSSALPLFLLPSTMKFQRPTGVAADVSELEFVSALHQVSF